MPTYNPLVPSGTVPLNEDYQNLQDNFNQANVVMGVDHLPFNNATAQTGYHTAIHLVPQSTPTNAPGYGQIYSTTQNDGLSNDQTLLYQTGIGNLNIQLTRNVLPVVNTNGYSFIPGPAGTGLNQGALLLQWGRVTNPGSNGTVTFPKAFPKAVFNIQLTYQRPSTSNAISFALDNGTPPTVTAFTYYSTTGGSSFLYWFAIGY
jgi:hypothetical protein